MNNIELVILFLGIPIVGGFVCGTIDSCNFFKKASKRLNEVPKYKAKEFEEKVYEKSSNKEKTLEEIYASKFHNRNDDISLLIKSANKDVFMLQKQYDIKFISNNPKLKKIVLESLVEMVYEKIEGLDFYSDDIKIKRLLEKIFIYAQFNNCKSINIKTIKDCLNYKTSKKKTNMGKCFKKTQR